MSLYCVGCGQSVSLYGGKTQRPHFRHRYGTADPNCDLAVAAISAANAPASTDARAVSGEPVREVEMQNVPIMVGPRAVESDSVGFSSSLLWMVVVVIIVLAVWLLSRGT
jgi:hypothetical protein